MSQFDNSITEKGRHIMTATPDWPYEFGDVENWIKEVKEQSGQRIDWHWIGGRMVIWCEGDIYKAKHYLETLKPGCIYALSWVADSKSVIPLEY